MAAGQTNNLPGFLSERKVPMNTSLQIYAPEDVFSGIVNKHHDRLKAESAAKVQAERRRREHRRFAAKAAAISIALLAAGFLIGVQVVLL